MVSEAGQTALYHRSSLPALRFKPDSVFEKRPGSYVPPRFARGERNYTGGRLGLGEKVTRQEKIRAWRERDDTRGRLLSRKSVTASGRINALRGRCYA